MAKERQVIEPAEIRLFESLETIEDERKAAGTEREVWI